jgi:hypothetical protein
VSKVAKYVILQGCPRCGKFPVLQSHRRGWWDRLRSHVTGKSPYRCRACRWRGWAHASWDRRQRSTKEGFRLARRADDKPA